MKAVLLLLTIASCSSGSCHAETRPTTRERCSAACSKMRSLACPDWADTGDGARCEDVCENVESSGVMSLNPSCVADAATCDDAKVCAETEPPP